ncbi:DDE-1 domain-containing protein [Trichonephila clavipes]|nr:DDE-1 domain-containing protein [Trichonephila clavipes]
MWRSNQRAWVTQDLFKEWLFKVCASSIKDYLDTNDLPLKALLLLDNAPGHPKDLKDNLLMDFPWLTVQFLPPNTTSLIQPMDQERKLCPSFVQGDGGDQGDTPEIMDEILTTARNLELEVNEDDIEELIMGHEDELTTEELQEILNEEHQKTQRNVSPSEQEEDERGLMPTSAIKDLLKKNGRMSEQNGLRMAPKPS